MQGKISRYKSVLWGAIASIFIIGTSLYLVPAQAKQKAVATHKDWSVFTGTLDNKKVCYIASSPTKSTASKSNVKRGDIYLMVANRPGDNVKNEVSFVAGYPLKESSVVTAIADSTSYELFTQGEGAWTPSAKADSQIVNSMRKGLTAIFKGISSRGTRTTDTFSLIGFTDALDDARKRCS